jgi:hypothetical protein
VSAQQHAAAAVAFTTAGPGQEMLVHFNFNKDREGLFRPEDHAALQRCVCANVIISSLFILRYINDCSTTSENDRKPCGLSPQVNYADRVTAACRRFSANFCG